MRIAAITDIHANLPALEAVLGAIDEDQVDEIWCLGDVVGYGADPDACTALAQERCDVCLVGNHDLAVLGALEISAFSEAAAEAVLWTREKVAEQTLDFLRQLDPTAQRNGIELFHASPRDPVWEYVLSGEQAEGCLNVLTERIALIGHSHVALFFSRIPTGTKERMQGAQANDGATLDLSNGSWLVNPGSVGQPRDGDPRAAWLLLDTDESTAHFHRTPYDIERAAQSISKAGLPQRLADRLYTGQ